MSDPFEAVDRLVSEATVTTDRPAGTTHPRHPDVV